MKNGNRDPSPELVEEMRRKLRADREQRRSNPSLPAFKVRHDEVTALVRATAAECSTLGSHRNP